MFHLQTFPVKLQFRRQVQKSCFLITLVWDKVSTWCSFHCGLKRMLYTKRYAGAQILFRIQLKNMVKDNFTANSQKDFFALSFFSSHRWSLSRNSTHSRSWHYFSIKQNYHTAIKCWPYSWNLLVHDFTI